jgi:hypothetical protein
MLEITQFSQLLPQSVAVVADQMVMLHQAAVQQVEIMSLLPLQVHLPQTKVMLAADTMAAAAALVQQVQMVTALVELKLESVALVLHHLLLEPQLLEAAAVAVMLASAAAERSQR